MTEIDVYALPKEQAIPIIMEACDVDELEALFIWSLENELTTGDVEYA